MADVGQRVVMDVRNALFRHILDQSAAFFARRTTGQLMSRITNDVGQVQQAVSETLGDLLRESLALVGYVGAAVLLRRRGWRSSSSPARRWSSTRWCGSGSALRRTTRRSQEELEHLSHVSAEAFTGHRIVKAFGTEEQEAARFAQAAERLYRTNMKVTAVAVEPAADHGAARRRSASSAALWYGSRRSRGQLTTGEFTSFIAALFLMYGPAKKLSRVNANLQQAIAASERIFEMLDTHTEVLDRPGAAPLAPL